VDLRALWLSAQELQQVFSFEVIDLLSWLRVDAKNLYVCKRLYLAATSKNEVTNMSLRSRLAMPTVRRKKLAKPKAEIHIIKDQCKGCGYCINYCPTKVLEESEEINARGVHPPKVVDEKKCILCSFCIIVCPDFAIFVKEKQCMDGC
jgi:2-oxoglutarate ferredoxin oxidoreductase subunit delta